MADILIRNLEEKTVKCLKLRAQNRGQSLQVYLKSVLDQQATTRGRTRVDQTSIIAELEKWQAAFRNKKMVNSLTDP
jgi:plasmid stability protein